MNPIEEALRRLERDAARSIKDAMQKVPGQLAPYMDTFRTQSEAGQRKSVKTKARYYSTPNRTPKMRRLYGNLDRATQVGGKGNISRFTEANKINSIEFGYDTSTTVKAGPRTTTLIYGKINEERGFPLLKPAMELFMKDAGGFPQIILELETDLLDAYNHS